MEDDTPAPAPPMPDRLCIHPDSPFYVGDLIRAGVGIRFKGAEKSNVAEYCVSEGWVKVQAQVRGKDGRPVEIKLQGAVEPYRR